ncbi:MAG: hypothetical protein Q8Q25_00930 [bacterium]|nr:hypothetical protein [bacterium]
MRIVLALILLLSTSPLFSMLRVVPRCVQQSSLQRFLQSRCVGTNPIVLRRFNSGFSRFSAIMIPWATVCKDKIKTVRYTPGDGYSPCSSYQEYDLEASYRAARKLEEAASDEGEKKVFNCLAQFYRAKQLISMNRTIAYLLSDPALTSWGRKSNELKIEELKKKKAAFFKTGELDLQEQK